MEYVSPENPHIEFPPHHNYVATLPYEIWKFKIIAQLLLVVSCKPKIIVVPHVYVENKVR